MKTIIISKKDLKHKKYENAKVTLDNTLDAEQNLENELADFLLSCFKIFNKTESNSNDKNSIGLLGGLINKLQKEPLCISIQIDLKDLNTLKREIFNGLNEIKKQINAIFYEVDTIKVSIIDNFREGFTKSTFKIEKEGE